MNLDVDRREAPVRLTPDLLPLIILAETWNELEEPYSPVDGIQLMLEFVCSLEGDGKGMTLDEMVDRLLCLDEESVADAFLKSVQKTGSDVTCFINLFDKTLPSLFTSTDKDSSTLLTVDSVLGIFLSHAYNEYGSLTFTQLLKLHSKWKNIALHQEKWSDPLCKKTPQDKVALHMARQDYAAAIKEAVLSSDRNVATTDQSDLGQLNIGARALRVTSIHAHFENTEEGISSLEEAIRLGLRDNNPLLLEHCLAWFHHLHPFQASDAISILKRFISTAEELKEPLLAGWGRLEESKALLSSGVDPAKVLLSLLSSVSSNFLPVYCPPSDKVDHLGTVFITMAMVWEQYGFRHVSQMYCQLIGHMMSHDRPPSEKERENFVLSLSVLIRYMLHSGNYTLVLSIIKVVKNHLLSHNRSFKLLCQCEEEVGFDWSIQNGDIITAREHLVRLQSLDKDSALIRSITLKAAQVSHFDSLTAAHQLLSSSSTTSPYMRIRTLLLLAELHSSSGSPSLSLPLLSTCLSLSHTHHISAYPTKLLLAQIHLQMGSPIMCEMLSRECLLQFNVNSHAVNRAISQLLLDQASLYIRSQQSGHLEKKDGLAIISSLKRTVSELERCQATKYLRRATVLLAYVYNLVGCHTQRDQMAETLRPTYATQHNYSI